MLIALSDTKCSPIRNNEKVDNFKFKNFAWKLGNLSCVFVTTWWQEKRRFFSYERFERDLKSRERKTSQGGENLPA